MTSCELATIAQEKIKINVAIINNRFLGMVRQWQEFFYDKRYAATPLTGPDFVKLAEAYGLKGVRVITRPEVTGAVQDARKEECTVVFDFHVEQEDSVFPMVPAGAALDKMIRRPKRDILAETGADGEWQMPAANGSTAPQKTLPVVVPVTTRKPAKVAASVARKRTTISRR
jgi:acetolactate synthase-1/2/3 large subunit